MTLETYEKEGATFAKLCNDVGLEVTLCDFGAGIYEIVYDKKAMTLSEMDKAAWLKSDTYFGKTVGRIAGRIKSSKLNYLGKVYSLQANEGANCLHGGPHGFSFRFFHMDIVHLDDGTAVDFYLLSKSADEGFPGDVNFRVRYFLFDKEATLRILFESKVSEQTPLNFTNHSYFNLGGEKNIEHQRLWINATESETYDSELIPLGFQKSPSCLDFSTPKEIGRDIQDKELTKTRTNGYDHCFRFKDNRQKQPVVSLESSLYRMELSTSFPCVQVYSHNYPHEGELLSNGQKCTLHSGVAIEPVYAPNDFHTMTVLPFEGRKNFIQYAFSKKE